MKPRISHRLVDSIRKAYYGRQPDPQLFRDAGIQPTSPAKRPIVLKARRLLPRMNSWLVQLIVIAGSVAAVLALFR